MALDHYFIVPHFAFYILHSAFCLRQILCLGASVRPAAIVAIIQRYLAAQSAITAPARMRRYQTKTFREWRSRYRIRNRIASYPTTAALSTPRMPPHAACP